MATISERQQHYRTIVKEILAHNRVGEPADIIGALLIALEDLHWGNVLRGESNRFDDQLDGVTGKHAVSLADSLRNLATRMADMHQQNADNERSNGLESAPRELLAAHTSCIADILNAVLPLWDADAQKKKELLDNMPRHVSPREGDPIYEPWEGRPVDFEGKPSDEPWDGRTKFP
jgi:hypothetical protein